MLLLVDKTIFQYGALTICNTTISGRPPSAASTRTTRGKRTPWTRRITTTSASRGGMGRHGRAGSHHHQRPRRRGSDALDAPGSSPPTTPAMDGRKRRPRTRRDHHQRPQPRKDGTRPDQHTATPAAGEGERWGTLCRILPSASTPRRKGRPRRAGIATTSTRSHGGSGRPGCAGITHQRQHAAREGDAMGVTGSPPPAQPAVTEGKALDMLTPSASTEQGRPRIPFRRSCAAMICISFRVYCASF